MREETYKKVEAAQVRKGISFAQAAGQGMIATVSYDALEEMIERVLQSLLPSLLKAIPG